MTQAEGRYCNSDQLSMPFLEDQDNIVQPVGSPLTLSTSEFVLPIEPTFDPSQGLHEVICAWQKQLTPVVVFDGRYLELAEQNIHTATDLHAPYIGNHGSVINLSVFLNILRCYGALSKIYSEKTNGRLKIRCEPPKSGTRVRELWDVLGMSSLINEVSSLKPPLPTSGPLPDFFFESRYVSPILWAHPKIKLPN